MVKPPHQISSGYSSAIFTIFIVQIKGLFSGFAHLAKIHDIGYMHLVAVSKIGLISYHMVNFRILWPSSERWIWCSVKLIDKPEIRNSQPMYS